MSAKKTPPGYFVWFEGMTPDAKGSKKFYTELLGWKVEEMTMPNMPPYNRLAVGERGIGGIMETDPKQGVPPHWLGAVHVESVDATMATAKKHGAKEMMPPTDIPGIGRFAILMDPQGATFGILKTAPR